MVTQIFIAAEYNHCIIMQSIFQVKFFEELGSQDPLRVPVDVATERSNFRRVSSKREKQATRNSGRMATAYLTWAALE